jgi:hypothetical protein
MMEELSKYVSPTESDSSSSSAVWNKNFPSELILNIEEE